ncbi:DUF805 domain-containing protein [Streptomyces sp. NPDC002309]
MNWFITALKKYAVFSGRARRKEYWMFFLFYMILAVAAAIIDVLINMQIVSLVLALGLFLPSLSITIRRLHDTDRSGWWILIGLIPLVGGIVLLVFACTDGKPGDNKYGPNPKDVPAHA